MKTKNWKEIEKNAFEEENTHKIGIISMILIIILSTGILITSNIIPRINKNIFEITKSEYKNVYDFQDKSWFILDKENEYYIFQAVELGDYDYQLNNETELKNVIKTYFMNKYNTNEEETEKEIENIFKNIK